MTEKMRIIDTGAATFSNNLTLSSASSVLDVSGVAVIRGNGSAYNTHYFTTGASNVAKYIQYNASGTAINQISAGEHSYFNSGCNVGIGTSTPVNKLQIGAMSYPYSGNEFAIGSGTVDFAIDVTATSVDMYSSAAMSFATTTSERLRIASTGIACFACQVCAPVAIFSGCVGIGSTSPQFKLDIQGGSLGIYHNTNYSGGASGAQLYLGDMNFAGGGYACSAPGIGAVCSPVTGVAGDLAFYTYTGVVACRPERMRIISGGNVGIGNTSPLTKLHVNNAVAGAILPYIQGTGLSYNNEGISVAGSNTNNTNIGNGLTLYNNVASVGACCCFDAAEATSSTTSKCI